MASVFHKLGPFEILREIGRGGMAVVFLAQDTRNDSRVALKLVPQGTDREAHEILEAEQWGAELQKQFCQISPHVPFVYEHGLESGYFYVAMEYLDGENLSDLISRGPVPVERAATIGVELCRFLEDAHRFEATVGERQLRRLLHGDLKPRNVRITPDGHVKVLDFGIAKALSLSRKVTRNDFGSMAYLSPERLESGEVDAYADYWAVGVLLHEMLTGSPAISGARHASIGANDSGAATAAGSRRRLSRCHAGGRRQAARSRSSRQIRRCPGDSRRPRAGCRRSANER